ncbi:hypothetical protein NP493_172g03077 [Ridgeia piscesae]|uniref:Acyl-CoA-binding domain-containing protein 6 n=1 Tax=Ridgeia piscesae TaxID=27915 RepID=A0AAD9P393_RIDPI|nr:hypothetical protein NP493_172g03077 [Ridgeia piscesae]
MPMEECLQLQDIFAKATNYVKSSTDKLDSTRLLYLYARYKQANEGPCNTSRPGFFDFRGKQKWDAWKGLGSMSGQDAMKEYIGEVTRFDPEWLEKIDSGKVKAKAGMGITVSTMARTEEDLADNEKTIFDWCAEENIDRVASFLHDRKVDVNCKNKEGMALMHWACDRGNKDMVEMLLNHKADINIRVGNSAVLCLPAVSCGHVPVVKILLYQRD